MISIVDYGVGNLKSLLNAFRFLGISCQLISTVEEVLRADKIVLPGVGAFRYAMDNINRLKFSNVLIERAAAKVPILGICLGMQLLFTQSDEGGTTSGLNLIGGEVKRFRVDLKIPHIGWNEVLAKPTGSNLLKDLPDSRFAYFVHSYFCEPKYGDTVIATTEYGHRFPAIVAAENIFGVQFHPEKSQELGLQILKNFARL